MIRQMNIESTNDKQPTAPAIPYSECYRQPFFQFYCQDSLIGIKKLNDNTVNCILTDPPYLYLKGQKLEREFDELLFFTECKRVLKDDGFIVLFGRGASFYRWNTILSNLGFTFKEEIIWNKRMNSMPGIPLMRKHETISIFTKKTGKINRVYVDYLDKKKFDLYSMQNDIKRIASAIDSDEINDLKKFLETGEIDYEDKKSVHFFKNGHGERSRATATLKSMQNGLCESSIIEELRDHYNSIHPTQKPVRLIERLLALTTKEGDLVLDAFAGSCSIGISCLNTKRKFIGYEIDKEYFDKAVERIKCVEPRLF